jgi:hypothetical protein
MKGRKEIRRKRKNSLEMNLLRPHDRAQFNFCRFPYVTPSLPHTGLNCGGAGQSHPSREPLPSTTEGTAPSSTGSGRVCGVSGNGTSSGSGLQNGGTKSSHSVCLSTRVLPLPPSFSNRTVNNVPVVENAVQYNLSMLTTGSSTQARENQTGGQLRENSVNISYFCDSNDYMLTIVCVTFATILRFLEFFVLF